MKNIELTNTVTPMSTLATYHQEIVEKYKDMPAGEIKANPDTHALMAFNGYYTLNTAAGAFFAVDTNMLVQDGAAPIYDLSLLISLDGTTSAQFPFTGTFDGKNLVQHNLAIGSVNIDLTFVHTDGSDGTTATCSGTISLPGKSAVQVSGATYNNPIPSSLYIGKYYEKISGNATPVEVMRIGDNYQLWYDNGMNNGELQPVKTYMYNLNMYYFSFSQGALSVSLIMGTASANGFACNNMIVDNSVTPGKVTTRSLLTIPTANVAPFVWYDISNSQLAGFSGYYQIPAVAPLAFISVQAQYATISESLDLDLYFVMISVSMDGVTSEGYYFDPATMKFENNTLTMPDQSISITFNREYNANNGSLVTITGSIKGKEITGNTLLNPVPLSVFGGVAMTNEQGDKLTVTNDNKVIYNGVTMDSIIYVPLMYILAYPITQSTIVMSFGTNGVKGNTCIITDYTANPATTSVVYAIPNA